MPNTTVISVVATKGGVGKTTLAANMAGLLADMGMRVLAIDADMQPSLSKYYPLVQAPSSGMADVISRGGLIEPADISPSCVKGLDLNVSNMSDHTQAWLKEREDRLILLKRAVRQPIVRDNYDYVLIDTQGAAGELQRSAAMAAELMISPLWPRLMEYVEFHAGTLDMLKALNAMADLSAELRSGPLTIVINGMDRTRAARLIAEQIRKDFRSYPGIRLLDTLVPDAKAYPEARLRNQPVHRVDLPRKDRVQASGHEIMHRLILEMLLHLKGLWVDDPSLEPERQPDCQEATEAATLGV